MLKKIRSNVDGMFRGGGTRGDKGDESTPSLSVEEALCIHGSRRRGSTSMVWGPEEGSKKTQLSLYISNPVCPFSLKGSRNDCSCGWIPRLSTWYQVPVTLTPRLVPREVGTRQGRRIVSCPSVCPYRSGEDDSVRGVVSWKALQSLEDILRSPRVRRTYHYSKTT